jgi:hypothetical protein
MVPTTKPAPAHPKHHHPSNQPTTARWFNRPANHRPPPNNAPRSQRQQPKSRAPGPVGNTDELDELASGQYNLFGGMRAEKITLQLQLLLPGGGRRRDGWWVSVDQQLPKSVAPGRFHFFLTQDVKGMQLKSATKIVCVPTPVRLLIDRIYEGTREPRVGFGKEGIREPRVGV